MPSPPPTQLLARLDALSQGGLRQRVPLAPYTSFRIGGPADFWVTLTQLDHLQAALDALHQARVPYWLLAGGTNLLISDAGVRGVVIQHRCREVHWPDPPYRGPVTVTAAGGVPLAGLAREALQRGLAGLSWAVSVPGTVGGAVVGNAGAHGHDIASIFVSARVWHQGRITRWGPEAMAFAYRFSRLKPLAARPGTPPVLLDVTLRLEPGRAGRAQEAARQAMTYRRRTQPIDRSAGSIFKNPPGDYAGRLIEAVGLKGHCIGQACISQKHANFIINRGQARAHDVLDLMILARREVWRHFHILLEPEILLVGQWPQDPPLPDPRTERAPRTTVRRYE